MANKLSIDVQMDSSGYVRGAQEATKSTEDLEKSTKEYLDSFGSLKKQMNSAKKEAQNLAAQFALLSKAEKQSDFGKNLKAQMNEAIEKAAELQDVFNDTNQAIKNAASDTAAWDAMKQGFDIGKSAAMTYAAAISKVTGDTESLTNVIKTLTMVENGFNTVIKVGNALQKQSSIMLGIKRIQALAAAKAEEALKKQTVGATVAQKAYNAVAKANPYVLLATLAVAAAAAIGGYMLATKKAKKEEDDRSKSLKKLEDIQKQYISSLSSEYGKLMGDYTKLKLSWKQLSDDHQKAKWIKENQQKLHELGIEVKTVKDAEAVFAGNTNKVIESFRARAKAAALAAQAVQLYTKSMEIEAEATERYNAIKKKAGDKASNTDFNNGDATYNNRTGEYEYTAEGAKKANAQLWQTDKILKQLYSDYDVINDKIEANLKAQEAVNREVSKTQKNTKDEAGGKQKSTEVNPNLKLSDKLDKTMKKQFEDLTKKIQNQAQQSLDKVKLEFKPSFVGMTDVEAVKNKIQAQLQNTTKEIDWNFENLPKSLKEAAEKGVKNLDNLNTAFETAVKAKQEFMKAGNAEGVAAMDEQIQQLNTDIEKQTEELTKYHEKSENIQKTADAFNTLGNYAGQVGNAFTMLGQALGSEGLQVMGIIAETIANIMLSFSQALVQAATMGPWAWIAFGIQGIAQVAAMVAQIKNLAADNGFAQGGVVGGNSWTGDKLWARVNSGERILTAEQNKQFEEMSKNISGAHFGSQVVEIEGVIRGKDLLLVQKNYNTIGKKSGTNIKIN